MNTDNPTNLPPGRWDLDPNSHCCALSDQGMAEQFLASTLLSRWFLCRYCFNCERTRYPKSSRLVPATLRY